MSIGICMFPLAVGTESGRGLERVIGEFCAWMSDRGIPYTLYENASLRRLKGSSSRKDELRALFLSVRHLFRLGKSRHDCFFAGYPVAGVFPAFLRKKPLVTCVFDLIPFNQRGFDNSIKYAIKRWCARYVFRRSDFFIVPFPGTRSEMVSRFRVSAEKIAVISQQGVNRSTYFHDPALPRIKFRIAFLGEAKRAKGLDTLLRAFQTVVGRIPESTLAVASSGNELPHMQKLAADLLPAGSYTFMGFIPEERMRSFYHSADLFVFPSRYGFGLSSLEAMACGTPAIVGAALDAGEFITDHDLLVDPDNPAELAEKIIQLLTHRELYDAKVRQALEMAARLTWQDVSAGYFDICQKAAGHVKTSLKQGTGQA